MKKLVGMSEKLFNELVEENQALLARAEQAESRFTSALQVMDALLAHISTHVASCPPCQRISMHAPELRALLTDSPSNADNLMRQLLGAT